MEYKELINTEPLGSIERLILIKEYGNKEQSEAAERCIRKRIDKIDEL